MGLPSPRLARMLGLKTKLPSGCSTRYKQNLPLKLFQLVHSFPNLQKWVTNVTVCYPSNLGFKILSLDKQQRIRRKHDPFPGPVKTGQEKYVPNLISVSVPVRKKLTKDTFNIERFT